MADEVDQESKTEDPTPRRREEARRQGQVPFSAELVGSLVTLAGVVGLIEVGPDVGATMLDVFRHDLPRLLHPEFGPAEARELFARTAVRVLGALAPFLGLLVAVGVGASLVQVGFQVNTEKLEPNFDKLNPATGAGRLFSVQALVRGLLTLLKVAALAGVAYLVVDRRGGAITGIGRDRLPGAVQSAWAVTMRLAVYLSAAVAGVAVLDYLYQRRRFEQSLRMTRQELKEELKQEEGDPQIKARVRQIQRERSRRRMLAEVPKASVVVTNPTHYAVALRYDAGRDAAPVVVARATGPFARRVAALARDSGVPVLERPTLARALYAAVREGQPIPGPLFRAVAEVLAFVYRLRGGAGAGGAARVTHPGGR
ncbi:MAG: flagellar biosynthesis protein FlhB, partial [Gemmataceae bacterium]|nr:flagellar biosynthesis protein FlhB [Gemmataceae bacterium]